MTDCQDNHTSFLTKALRKHTITDLGLDVNFSEAGLIKIERLTTSNLCVLLCYEGKLRLSIMGS